LITDRYSEVRELVRHNLAAKLKVSQQ
jgi:hypothetical protein